MHQMQLLLLLRMYTLVIEASIFGEEFGFEFGIRLFVALSLQMFKHHLIIQTRRFGHQTSLMFDTYQCMPLTG